MRRRSLSPASLLVLLLCVIAACGKPERAPEPTAADVELARAWAGVRALAARDSAALTDAEVVTLGYVERLRLGLGSPFRLMDYALQDPRLDPAARHRTALALLQATREGRAYAVDPRALSLMGVDSAGRAAATARMHLDLVDGAVAGAPDPRDGELAVRAAYQLAAAEHLVTSQSPVLAAQAAALARDRVLARRDAERLLAAADSAGRHPLPLLREWRAARRFEVEAPTGAARPPYREVRAASRALPLAARVRVVATGGGAPERERVPIAPLPPAAARRLTMIAREFDPPPSAPIAVTLDRYGPEMRRAFGGSAGRRRAVEQFLARARTEERFAAELARLADGDDPHPRAALVAMEAAVALRAYAQETVWYPGFAAPLEADLKRAYGLASVGFDGDVPIHWHPFYRRMLGESLADLESVLPGLDLHGLSFRFGRTGREGSAIALHYPASRRIHLPPQTGPGTIAHEVAHDLDWQVGRDRYGRRGAYATDLALHRPDADHFAAAVRRLPLGPTGPRKGPEGAAHDTRPAEAFARLFDGFVTSTLASRGRGNGYLSSLQDDVLTGHGTAVAPDARGEGAEAFLPLLMVASPLTEGQAAEFRLRWGARRTPGPLSLMGEVAAAGDDDASVRRGPWRSLVDLATLDADVRMRIGEVEAERARALQTRAMLVCANPFLSPVAEGEASVRALIDGAADARIRGILRRWARARGVDADPETLRAAWLTPPAEPDPPSPFQLSCD
ncbi:hypothetical protein [Longimicrobium sp.]|uniref:hypothetical protein n=1 Tax=Longimicrobium sp. TaxID=2029185 RepID=UPI002E2FA85B|nr:hypothetical protein [Longimicrobium sp.]HEX6036985.1 hypothetical protein [Longimicrobium sp.]